MDGMITLYAFISFAVALILICLIVVLQSHRHHQLMHELIEAYGATLSQVAKDAMIQSKAHNAEEAMRAITAAAYERESLKQQVEDHKAWREQVIHNNFDNTPIDEHVSDGTVTLDDGEEYHVRERNGRKILVNNQGEEFDVLAGA